MSVSDEVIMIAPLASVVTFVAPAPFTTIDCLDESKLFVRSNVAFPFVALAGVPNL